MLERLISGDNHIDLTYCPPDLWSSQAPAKWKLLVPRVEELEDGCHWFVDAQDQGVWNGGGPRSRGSGGGPGWRSWRTAATGSWTRRTRGCGTGSAPGSLSTRPASSGT